MALVMQEAPLFELGVCSLSKLNLPDVMRVQLVGTQFIQSAKSSVRHFDPLRSDKF